MKQKQGRATHRLFIISALIHHRTPSPHAENAGTRKLGIIAIAVIFSIIFPLSVYCQFADLPQDAKTVDIGVNGDGASQTLSLTAVVPFRRLNGWVGFLVRVRLVKERCILKSSRHGDKAVFASTHLVLRCLRI